MSLLQRCACSARPDHDEGICSGVSGPSCRVPCQRLQCVPAVFEAV